MSKYNNGIEPYDEDFDLSECIDYEEVAAQTSEAVLLRTKKGNVWVPTSQTRFEEGNVAVVPSWLYDRLNFF